MIDESADLLVRVGDIPGISLLEARVNLLLLGGKAVPRLHVRIAWRELRVGRNDAKLFLPSKAFCSYLVPPLIIDPSIHIDIVLWYLVRRVGCAKGDIKKERLLREYGNLIGNELYRVVYYVFREVISGLVWNVNHLVIGNQLRVILISFPGQEAVVPLESLSERPVLEGTRRGYLIKGSDVPLADAKSTISLSL